MRSPLENAIRDHVERYVVGNLTLGELDTWLWPATWNIEEIDDPVATDLTYEIILRMAEFDHGDWSEDQLKDLLRPIAAATAIGAATP